MRELLGKVVAARPIGFPLPEPYAVTRVMPNGELHLVCIRGGFYSAVIVKVSNWLILGHYQDDEGIVNAINSLTDLLTDAGTEIDDRARSEMQAARRALVDALEASMRAQYQAGFKAYDAEVAERKAAIMSDLTQACAELRADPINPPSVNKRLRDEMMNPDAGIDFDEPSDELSDATPDDPSNGLTDPF